MIIKKCKKKNISPFVGSVLVDILYLAVVAIKQYKNSQKNRHADTETKNIPNQNVQCS